MSLLVLPQAASTQDELKRLLATGNAPPALMAIDQTAGRGRFGRPWSGAPGSSLALSVALPEWQGHQRPWLIGMSAACAVAGVFRAKVRWPNDVHLSGRKLAGILVEMSDGIPVVGIGVNLGIDSVPPELAGRATSLERETGKNMPPEAAAERILARLKGIGLPEKWQELAPVWSVFDETQGKEYLLHDGRKGSALGIGPLGELICSVEGETESVMAAEAWFGPVEPA